MTQMHLMAARLHAEVICAAAWLPRHKSQPISIVTWLQTLLHFSPVQLPPLTALFAGCHLDQGIDQGAHCSAMRQGSRLTRL